MNQELNLDVDGDEARALHRVVRAMHDGHCPDCGFLGDAVTFVIDRETVAERHECPQCHFAIFRHEAEEALAVFRPYLQKSVEVFERWRRQPPRTASRGESSE